MVVARIFLVAKVFSWFFKFLSSVANMLFHLIDALPRYITSPTIQQQGENMALLNSDTCSPEEFAASKREPDNDEGPDDDDDQCEEWER